MSSQKALKVCLNPAPLQGQEPPGDVGRQASNVLTDHQALWTETHAELEAQGGWARLLGEYENLGENTCDRWHAAAMRAYAFLGSTEEAHKTHARLLNSVCSHPESEIVCDLALAIMLRRERLWIRAKLRALRAYRKASKIGNKTLMNDAEFAVSLCLSEEGRLFLALDGFQKIALSPTAASYRKSLAALNTSWLLWDTGQPHAIHSFVEEVPESFRERLKLMLALHQLDHEAVIRVLENHSIPERRFAGEVEQIVFLCLEWAFLFKRELNTLAHLERSWIPAFLEEAGVDSSQPAAAFYLVSYMALRSGQPLGEIPASEDDWRTHLEYSFLQVLSRIASDKVQDHDRARELYEQSVLPNLRKRNLMTPLLPRPESFLYSMSPWVAHLALALGYSPTESAKTIHKSSTLVLSGTGLCLASDLRSGHAIDLSKSAISLRLLREIAGSRGHKISKRALHEGLTGTRYNQHLHDDRLHKLLKRLESKIRDAFGIKPWNLPGDNHLVLECDIEADGV